MTDDDIKTFEAKVSNKYYYVVPGNFHTHPLEDHWKLQGGGVSTAKNLEGKV